MAKNKAPEVAPQEQEPQAKQLKFRPVIEWRNVADLKPYPNNCKLHTQEQLEKLAAVIRADGFDVPIVINPHNDIIKGHGRRAALLHLGVGQCPVIVRDDLTPQQERRIRISDNRLSFTDPKAAALEFDKALLSLELKQLDYEGCNMSLTGCDVGELKDLMNFKVLPEADCSPDDGGPMRPENSVTKPGDIWILGDHRLMCGSSTSFEHINALFNGAKADMVFTDPPYGVGYTGGAKKRKPLVNDEPGTPIYADVLPVLFEYSAPNAPLYLWYADVVIAAAAAAAAGYSIRAQIVWVKNNAQFVTSAHYKGKHELAFYCVKGESAPWYGPNNEVTVWDFDRANKNDYHPTQKPVELAERAMLNSSKQADIIFDAFGGSGSTLIAAQKLRRVALVMELDPGYCDVIIKRWQKYTRDTAILEGNGKSFAELEGKRKK